MKVRWRRLDLANIPAESGVYGFKIDKNWLYIGKADNLKRRLVNQHIPLQIVLECFPDATFHYILAESPLRLEKHLHEQLKPLWNGRTARVGSKFPLCEIPTMIEVSHSEISAAINVLTID